MRSTLALAGPISSSSKRYESTDDDEDAQKDVVIDFSVALDDLSKSSDTKYQAIEIIAYNSLLNNIGFRETL